jgi:hypothetical protein
MDRQLDRTGNRRVELHLTACADCAGRLQALEGRSRMLSSWLGDLDAPAPDDEKRALAMAAVERARFRARSHAWSSRPALAAAAMIALLLTITFGTPPGRAWVSAAAERLGRVFPGETAQETAGAPQAQTRVVPPASAPPAAVADAEPAAPAPTQMQRRPARPVLPPGMSEAVSFSPAGNSVLLKFDSWQRVGSVGLRVRSIQSASGQVVAGRTSETLVPTPDGLHVRNSRSSRADYTVEVPTRYRFIRLQIGDDPETVIAVSRARQDWIWNMSLAAGEN